MVYALVNEMKVAGRKIAGLELMLGDDVQLIEVQDATPDDGMRFNHGRATVSGRQIKLDHVPKKMKKYSDGVIPDYTSFYGLICVSDKLKTIVESVEPKVHQFIPFEIVDPDGKHGANHWFMVVCNRLDSVDRELSTQVLADGKMWLPAAEAPREQWPPHVNPDTPGKLCFNLSQIGDRHLWFDKHIIQRIPFVSEKLAVALQQAGVTGVSFDKGDVA